MNEISSARDKDDMTVRAEIEVKYWDQSASVRSVSTAPTSIQTENETLGEAVGKLAKAVIEADPSCQMLPEYVAAWVVHAMVGEPRPGTPEALLKAGSDAVLANMGADANYGPPVREAIAAFLEANPG